MKSSGNTNCAEAGETAANLAKPDMKYICCFRCNTKGHMRRNCPQTSSGSSDSEDGSGSERKKKQYSKSRSSANMVSSRTKLKPDSKAAINKSEFQTWVINSGSTERTMACGDDAHEHQGWPGALEVDGGHNISTLGKTRVLIEVAGKKHLLFNGIKTKFFM